MSTGNGRLTRLCSLLLMAWLPMIFATLPADAQEPVPVVVKDAGLGRFVDRVEALGTLRANETLELTATVSETVTAIHFEDGQRVEAGDILVEMTSREEHALIEEERLTIAEAKRQYDRVRPLVDRGAASPAPAGRVKSRSSPALHPVSLW